MKKVFLALFMAVLLVVSLAGTALAAGPTTTTVTWNGGGVINGSVNTGDTTTTFTVDASLADGTFTATDLNDNPYSYNVDTNSSYIQSNTYAGSTTFQTNRNTSYTPMYGASGQSVFAFVGSTGSGAMATGSGTNYASMINATYGQPKTAGGFNFEADAEGGSYQIVQEISANNAIAFFVANGSGTSKINSMTTGASRDTNTNLGWGGGSYTNANMVATGVGDFTIHAEGLNGITTPIAGASGAMVAGGWTASGISSLNTVMSYTNGGSVGNFSVKVQ